MDIDGNWMIIKMYHQGKEIYPHDYTSYRITFKIEGYEDFETLNFDSKDSILTVPGFHSEELVLKYRIESDSLLIYLDSATFDYDKTLSLGKKYEDLELKATLVSDSIYEQQLDSLNEMRSILIKSKGTASSQYDKSKSIYLGKYRLTKNRSKGLIFLECDKTSMMLMSQTLAASRRIDELFH